MSSLLRIDASARFEGSTSRRLADALVDRLKPDSLVHRDLTKDVPAFVDAQWIGANFTDEGERSAEQKAALASSDALIAELEAADTLVIASPIYNFSVPAALKAWIDQVARARKTFRYTETGPEGLLKGKKAYLVMASGGTAFGSEIDYASGYLKHIMGFVGITDVTVITAGQQMIHGETPVTDALEAIATI